MSHRLGFNGYSTNGAAPAATSNVIPFPGESGVYDNYATRVSQTLPSFWREDDDEQATRVRLPPFEAQRETILPAQPLQSRRALWQVALQLRGDELSRLWRRNAVHLAGRIFVWSDHGRQWVQLHSSPEVLPGNPRLSLPASAVNSTMARPEPVDLTRDARQQLMPLRLTRGWAVGIAASLLTIVAVAAWWPTRTPPVDDSVRQLDEQPRNETVDPVVVPKPEPVRVESLPLVTTGSNSPDRHVNAAKSRPSGDTARAAALSGVGSFSPVLARQALSRAAGRAGRCSSGEFSGSVLVTYEPSGVISDVTLSALAGDMSGSACIVNAFRSARIAPFQGSRVVVRKSFSSHT